MRILFAATLALGVPNMIDPALAKPATQRFEVFEASISDLQQAMTDGRTTAREIVLAYQRRIAAYDREGPALNAIITMNPDALADADRLDFERKSSGVRGPLHGVPVLVKDNFETKDMPTTAGTLALASIRPTVDALLVQRLRDAGAIIIGKATMHELAVGVTNISSLTGMTRNPYDSRRSPFGSSGGSAAAVAASFAAAALGTDTCGSIRLPAAAQNLFGLRPTAGLASTQGIVPLSTTQDAPGPLARSVMDLAIMMDATIMPDRMSGRAQSYTQALGSHAGFAGMRIGVVRDFLDPARTGADIVETTNTALAEMRRQGAILVNVEIPGLEQSAKDASVIAFEFREAFARYLAAHPDAPIATLKDIIDRGMDHEAVDATLRMREAAGDMASDTYRRALDLGKRNQAALIAAMEDAKVDALAYPAATQQPPLWGGELSGRATCYFSATSGLPSIAIPLGLGSLGMPVGLELLGKPLDETQLMQIAYAWEQAAKPRQPPVATPALLHDKAPPPLLASVQAQSDGGSLARAVGAMRYDLPSSRMRVDVRIKLAPGDSPIALTLHNSRADGSFGSVIASLSRRGEYRSNADFYVEPALRQGMISGRIWMQLYTMKHPLGIRPTPVIFASTGNR